MALEDLRWELRPTVLNKVRLLASELVTSAIAQAGHRTDDWVDVMMSVSPWQVRVEVSCDIGAAHGRFEYPPTWSSAMLDDLADDWGFVRDDEGRMLKLWFELDPSKATPLADSPIRPYVE